MSLTVHIAGSRAQVRPPVLTHEVLHLEGRVTHGLKAAVSAGRPVTGADILELTAWLVARIERIEDMPCWQEMEEEERLECIDEVVEVTDQIALYHQMVAYASLPVETLDGVRAWFTLILAGGCECPMCKHGVEPREGLEAMCKVAPIGQHVIGLVAQWTPIREEPVLSHPYWLHQLKSAWGEVYGGHLKAEREQREAEREKKDETQRFRQMMKGGR